MDSSAPTTLSSLLASSCVPLPRLISQYPSHLFLENRMLGIIPSCISVMAIHPPLFDTYIGLVPNLCNIPWSDIGSAWGWGISPEIRSLVMYVSSRSFGCMYCSSHCAVLGDIFRGSATSIQRNAEAWGASKRPSIFSGAEKAAMEYASALANVPCTVSEKHLRDLSNHFSPTEIQFITLTVTLGGFLNRCMDTLGMVLELEPHAYGQLYLSKSDWAAGKHADPGQAEQLEEMKRNILSTQTRRGLLEKIWDSVQLAAHGLRAYWADFLFRWPIPAASSSFRAFMESHLGFCPAYLSRTTPSNARQAITYAFLNILNNPSTSQHLTIQLKYLMALVLAVRAKSKLLQAHFAFLSFRNGASVSDVRMIVGGEEMGCQADTHSKLALEFARMNSGSGTEMSEIMMRRVADLFTAKEVVEMTAVVSVVTMLIRLVNAQQMIDESIEEEIKNWLVTTEGRKSGIFPE